MGKLFDIVKIFLFAVIIVIPIHAFLIQPYIVSDNIMAPQYSKGDIVLVSWIPYFSNEFQRNDIIVFRDSVNRKEKHISKIIGMPYERVTVNDGILMIKSNESIIYKQDLALFGTTVASLEDLGNLDEHEFYILGNKWIEGVSGIIDSRFIIGKPVITIFKAK